MKVARTVVDPVESVLVCCIDLVFALMEIFKMQLTDDPLLQLNASLLYGPMIDLYRKLLNVPLFRGIPPIP